MYGLDDTTADRIRSWRAHGYHVAVMTGAAWAGTGRTGAALAGVVGRRACIQPKELGPWRVVPNLWSSSVAESGQLQSPVLSAVTEPVKAIERG